MVLLDDHKVVGSNRVDPTKSPDIFVDIVV
jgi:hypothetical protein